MKNAATIQLDPTAMNNALRELQRLTGGKMSQIVRAEAGSVLKVCVNRTKVARAKSIGAFALRSARLGSFASPLSTTTGSRGGRVNTIWFHDSRSGQRFPAGSFAPSGKSGSASAAFRGKAIGRGLQSMVRGSIADMRREMGVQLPKRKRAAGLARQSWVQIADSLSIDLTQVAGGRDVSSAVAKARQAVATNGVRYINGHGASQSQPNRTASIRLTNTLPYNTNIGMDRILASAVSGRAAFFRRNLRDGVFKDMNKIATKYPGLRAS